ncbi:hypothetical protein J6590_055904 [Homalodisca vitripennis]|nr:hypothetical protein J6590_055904 [Homalodisca vitripennis]
MLEVVPRTFASRFVRRAGSRTNLQISDLCPFDRVFLIGQRGDNVRSFKRDGAFYQEYRTIKKYQRPKKTITS